MPKYFLAYAATIEIGPGKILPVFGNIVTPFDGDLDDGSVTAQHLTNFEAAMKDHLTSMYQETGAAVSSINVINWKRLD